MPQVKVTELSNPMDELVSPMRQDFKNMRADFNNRLNNIVSPMRTDFNNPLDEIASPIYPRPSSKKSEDDSEFPPETSYKIEGFRHENRRSNSKKFEDDSEFPPETSYKIEGFRHENLTQSSQLELDLSGGISSAENITAKIDPFSKLEYLSLAGNMLDSLVPLPRSLILLNLSNNMLSDLSTLSHLPNL